MTDKERADCIKLRAESNDILPCLGCPEHLACVGLALKKVSDRLQKGNDNNEFIWKKEII